MSAKRSMRLPIIKPGSIDCSFDSRLSEVQDMRYAHITLLLATAACAIAIATPAAAQSASTAASAYSNSAAAAPTMRHARRSLHTVQAQIHPQRALGYGSMQA